MAKIVVANGEPALASTTTSSPTWYTTRGEILASGSPRATLDVSSATDRYTYMPRLSYPRRCRKNEIHPRNKIQIAY